MPAQMTCSCLLISSVHFEEKFKKAMGYQQEDLLHFCYVEP